jgi:organic hydroperoxide reductase OsmC/OhrA
MRLHNLVVIMSEERDFYVEMTRVSGFQFCVDFGIESMCQFYMDEPEPLGKNTGPNAGKMVGAALANCLAASLMFCLQKSHVDVKGMKSSARGILERNENGRWRIMEVNVDLYPEIDSEKKKPLERCKEIFDDFCIVSKSIEQGIPVNVSVHDI